MPQMVGTHSNSREREREREREGERDREGERERSKERKDPPMNYRTFCQMCDSQDTVVELIQDGICDKKKGIL